MANFLKSLFTDFNTASTAYVQDNARSYNDVIPPAVDVLIIGGGLAGLSAARKLAQAGKSVLVSEAKNIGDGASGRSGGQLWPGFEGSLSDMIEEYGDNLAVSAWNYMHEGLKNVRAIAAMEKDNCDFQPGVLLTSKTTAQSDWIREETVAMNDAGFDWVHYIEREKLNDFLKDSPYHDAMLFQGNPGEEYGHLNPLKYTRHLAALTHKAGALIAENTPVTSLAPLQDGGYTAETSRGMIRAAHVVLATGANFMRPDGVDMDTLPRSFVKAKTIILATEPMTREIAKDIVPGTACFADASDSAMAYGRMIPANDGTDRVRLTFGGADALTQFQTAQAAISLEKEMYQVFPGLIRHGIKVEKIWGGECDLSRSALPVLSSPSDDMTYVAGFSGQGMVATGLYGEAIAEKIAKGTSEKFNLLAQLSPEPFHKSELIAKFQAAREMIPSVIQEWRDRRDDLKLGL